MKKKALRVVSLVLVAAALLTNTVFAAESRESKYISNYYGETVQLGDGLIKVTFDITGTGTMPTIGATKIDIYSLSEGKVATFEYTDEGYEYLMGSNTFYYFNFVTYQGVPGEKYFAIIKYYVGNATGGDTATYTTALV